MRPRTEADPRDVARAGPYIGHGSGGSALLQRRALPVRRVERQTDCETGAARRQPGAGDPHRRTGQMGLFHLAPG